MITNKYCSKCKITKSLDDFSRNNIQTNNKHSQCKKCRAKREKERRLIPEYKAKIKKYKEGPVNKRKTKNAALKRLFGITIEDFDRMIKEQNDLCAICFRPEVSANIKTLSVDHCHTTGKVRGLLCTNCNQGIGHFLDNIKTLENAIRYLKVNQ